MPGRRAPAPAALPGEATATRPAVVALPPGASGHLPEDADADADALPHAAHTSARRAHSRPRAP
ncbi:hypothetical protein ACFYNX_21330 [Streptomyces sp. NPDC007872]|uniref:hypothetical protein n=1 Tax=Streptomyces sp. NPDC007872 TaxID=3364782 RepID=UPI0036C8C823